MGQIFVKIARRSLILEINLGNNLGNFGGSFELPEARAGVKLGLRRSQEVRGSLELQNGSLRGLEEAWITTS